MKDKITIISMVPKFLQFFELAKEEADKDKRWELWKQHYGFAAVPPGEAGQVRARELFEGAWEKYPALVEKLADWKPDDEGIQNKIKAVKELFQYEGSLDINIVYYVGGFEGNAFVAPSGDGKQSLCFPVETEVSDIFFAHEITHIVHAQKARLTLDYERSIATAIMQEGLATRASQMLVPGLEDTAYIEPESNPGWLRKCEENREIIFEKIRPYLAKKDMDTLNKFFMGTGSTGIVDREVYYVGWVLVDYLLNHGETMASLASIKEEDLDTFIDKAIDQYRMVNQ